MGALNHDFHVEMDKGIIGIKNEVGRRREGVQGVVTALTNTVICQHLVKV